MCRNGIIRWVLGAFLGLGLAVSSARSQDAKPRKGEKYALLVGVRKYDPNELRSLPYAEADIVALAEVLRRNGYKPDNVVLMTQAAAVDDLRFLPTAEKIRDELTLLIQDTTAEDSVLVALAGHGVQFRDETESYFCPADARLSDRATLLPLGEIYKKLEGCRAGFKLLLVDACRNDPQSDNSRARSVVKLQSVSRPQEAPPPGGVAALFSCSAGEKAFEHEGLQHGVFFDSVIKGLEGAATDDESEGVTLPELELYVKKRVSDFVRARYGLRQMPELVGTSRGLVPLVTFDRAAMAMKRARALAEAGDVKKAIELATRAIELGGDAPSAYFERGKLRHEQKDYVGAIEDFNASISRRGTGTEVYYERGRAYYELEQNDWAIADLSEVLRREPENAFALNMRGIVYDYKGDQDRAIADYNEAIRLRPRDATFLTNRGSAYRKKGDVARALADVTEAIRIEPKSAWAYRVRAGIHLEREDYRGAVADSAEAIRLDPRDAVSFNRRGVAHSWLDQADQAFDDFTEAIRLDPKYARAYMNRSKCKTVRGRDRSAAAAQDRAYAQSLEPGIE